MSEDFSQRLKSQASDIYKLAGGEFNIASPKQLGEILFDKLSLPGGKKTKTGSYATGAEILEDLAANGSDIAAKVLDWRQVAKLKSTYTDALIEEINPKTGRIHTSYSMTGASTGRLSSNDPNLQNIPIRTEKGKKIRDAFIADNKNKLVSFDYSQIELRLAAEISKDKNFMQAFLDGVDIHASTAIEILK